MPWASFGRLAFLMVTRSTPGSPSWWRRVRLKDIPRFYPDIDLGLIHAGGTTFLITLVTMTGEQAVRAVEITRPRTAIPIHYTDFSVFTSGLDELKRAA